MNNRQFYRSQTAAWAGFGIAAVVAPFLGALTAYLLQPERPSTVVQQAPAPVVQVAAVAPTASPSQVIAVVPTSTRVPVVAREPRLTPTPEHAPAALDQLTIPITDRNAARVAAAPTATALPTNPPAAPANVAAKLLGFVWTAGSIYLEPGANQHVTGAVAVGDLVELLETRDGWWRIRAGTNEGWINKSFLIIADTAYTSAPQSSAPAAPEQPAAPAPAAPTQPVVEPTPIPPSPYHATLANGGNVRVGPGLNYTVVNNFNAGTKVELLNTKNGWWQIRVGAVLGWMSGTLLDVPPEAAKHWGVPVRPPAAQLQAARQASGGSLWSTNVTPGQLNRLPDVVAPSPMLVADAVGPYLRARTRVLQASGVDYLGRLDEAFRAVNYETNKPGVASMSWHKAGRAIDVAQAYNVKGMQGVVFARDASAPRYYRVFIRCAVQDGSLGAYYGPKQFGARAGFYVDVTAILLSEGWTRIAPQGSVSEAWHYEYRNGLKWSQAMNQLYPTRLLRQLFPSVWK